MRGAEDAKLVDLERGEASRVETFNVRFQGGALDILTST